MPSHMRTISSTSGVIGRPENDGQTNVWFSLIEYLGGKLSLDFCPLEYDYDRLAREMVREKLPEEFVTTVQTGWWTTLYGNNARKRAPEREVLNSHNHPLPIARIMHRFSAKVPPSSALTALRFLALLDVLHEYACGVLRRLPVRAAFSALRHKNLCLIQARSLFEWSRPGRLSRIVHRIRLATAGQGFATVFVRCVEQLKGVKHSQVGRFRRCSR